MPQGVGHPCQSSPLAKRHAGFGEESTFQRTRHQTETLRQNRNRYAIAGYIHDVSGDLHQRRVHRHRQVERGHRLLAQRIHNKHRQTSVDRIAAIEHADLDSLIDRAATDLPGDELAVRRLKKRRLRLRDQIARIEAELDPPQPA